MNEERRRTEHWFIRRFLQPTAALPAEEAQQAQLTTAVMVVFLAAMVLGVGAAVLLGRSPKVTEAAIKVTAPLALALLGLHRLSRTRHHRLAAVLVLVAVQAAMVGAVIIQGWETRLLMTVMAPVALASLLLPFRGAAAVTALALAEFFAAIFFAPLESREVLPTAMGVTVTVSMLLLMEAWLRARQHAQIQAQARRLAVLNRELEQEVTERTTALEQALWELTAAERTRTAVLSAMGHELRTPLTTILASGALLRARSAEAPPDVIRRHLDNILHSANILRRLVSAAQEVAQFESQEAVLRPEPVVLTGIVESMREAVQASNPRVKFTATLPSEGKVVLYTDRRVLEETLALLAVYPILHTPTVEAVHCTVSRAGGVLGSMAGSDQAASIHIAVQVRLPVRQYGGQPAAQTVSAGLAQRLVELLHGRLSIEPAASPEGAAAGYDFHLWLPEDARTLRNDKGEA